MGYHALHLLYLACVLHSKIEEVKNEEIEEEEEEEENEGPFLTPQELPFKYDDILLNLSKEFKVKNFNPDNNDMNYSLLSILFKLYDTQEQVRDFISDKIFNTLLQSESSELVNSIKDNMNRIHTQSSNDDDLRIP